MQISYKIMINAISNNNAITNNSYKTFHWVLYEFNLLTISFPYPIVSPKEAPSSSLPSEQQYLDDALSQH